MTDVELQRTERVEIAVSRGRQRNPLVQFYSSTVGKKCVMAITGLIGIGFVILHVSLNLLAYRGSTVLNGCDRALKSAGVLLWGVRLALLTAVLLHVLCAYQLARGAWASRPTPYRQWEPVGSDLASRMMRWTGALLILFIPLHVLHLGTGTLHPNFCSDDVYHNVVTAFRVKWVSAAYIVAMIALGLHLHHGSWSLFQSLGVNHSRFNRLIRCLAISISIAVVLGFISIPIAVLLGVISGH